MPELPDVEIYRKYMESTALDQKISQVNLYCPKILKGITEAELEPALNGRRFTTARRHGKYLFAALDNESWLVLHFGMTGFLVYFKDADKRPSHVCLQLSFDNKYNLAYDCQRKLGRISITPNMETYVKELGLGPDAMDPELRLTTFKDRVGKGRGMVKPALMKQENISGIGNIYADEILFQAGVNPKAKAGNLQDKTLRLIFQETQRVLATAIDCRADPADFPRSYIIPRRQPGASCPKCNNLLETAKVSGRTTYYCSQCQK
ncbi:MAG: Fpg/Nei family DNA glycosylase [Thermodesulfobacteriota bacterium]